MLVDFARRSDRLIAGGNAPDWELRIRRTDEVFMGSAEFLIPNFSFKSGGSHRQSSHWCG